MMLYTESINILLNLKIPSSIIAGVGNTGGSGSGDATSAMNVPFDKTLCLVIVEGNWDGLNA